MKILTLAILLFIVPIVYAAPVLDIEFKDNRGKLYHTTTLSKDMALHYGQAFATVDMQVLLIQTTSLSDEKYQTQNSYIDSLGHEVEEFAVIFITACTQQEDAHGYHTSIATAKKLSSEKSPFRVRLLNSKGVVLRDSSSPVTTTELRRWLKQRKS